LPRRSGRAARSCRRRCRSTIAGSSGCEPLQRDEERFLEERLRLRDAYLGNFGRLLDAGVRMVASTDAGWGHTPFGDLTLALELMVQAGMRPPEVLAAATGAAAAAIGVGSSVGTLTAGKLADILVVEGDATADVACVQRPLLVLKGGQVVQRAE
jgi:imidazolonepropionase-like amidohydrolase